MTIYELSMPEQKSIWELVGRVRERLLAEHQPDGFNIGFNDDLAAGQTSEHAHDHIIPRRQGETIPLDSGWRRAFAQREAWNVPRRSDGSGK